MSLYDLWKYDNIWGVRCFRRVEHEGREWPSYEICFEVQGLGWWDHFHALREQGVAGASCTEAGMIYEVLVCAVFVFAGEEEVRYVWEDAPWFDPCQEGAHGPTDAAGQPAVIGLVA